MFQQQGLMPNLTGYPQPGYSQGFNQPINGLVPQATGAQFSQPQLAPYPQAMPMGISPFSDVHAFQPQALSMQPTFQPQQLGSQPTGINSMLPPALQPQRTGFFPTPTNSFGSIGFQAPPIPPMPDQQPIAPRLVAQKTGPAPSIRFGVTGKPKPLMPQPTGRAQLHKATADNPFGFD